MLRVLPWALTLGLTAAPVLAGETTPNEGPFRRIASFPVFLNTDVEAETVAEIVTSADRGTLLVYTDSETEQVGFVDISDPADPQADGVVPLDGEPTSVAVRRSLALVAVNTSEDFINTSGLLQIVDIESRMIVRSIDLGGQPDSIAISPNGRYAAVAIENERDEELGDGKPPQLPAGFLVIVDCVGDVDEWTTREVDLTGLADLYPEDPEPEFVDINSADLAVVTLQENNHIVIVRLSDGSIVNDWSAGTVDLTQIDLEDNSLIEQVEDLKAVPREPDAVAWIASRTFSTADEGDLFGGSRGFTNFDIRGQVLFSSANTLEHGTARLGHYPEGRSDNKGCEPEGVEFGIYGSDQLLFVGSERSSVVFVYRLPEGDATAPELLQVLPTGVAPEGLLAIPNRNLFVVANEDDARDDKIRSSITIYAMGEPNYPTVVSEDRESGVPIPWGALSGLARGADDDTVYAVHDSFYQRSRIYTLDVGTEPAVIVDELELVDGNGALLNALDALGMVLPKTATADYDPTALVNADGSVNLDLEGIAVTADGGFWVASEGSGNLVDGVSDPEDRPFVSPNILARVDGDGTITDVVLPPLDLTLDQFRFGFEGVVVTVDGDSEVLWVAFQRAWQAAGDPADRARLGRYEVATGTWSFAYYPLAAPTSPNGGWVGVSELTDLGDGVLAAVERDNQGGPDAAIKLITSFDLDGLVFKGNDEVPSFEDAAKTTRRDLLAQGDLTGTGGLVLEKVEGMALLPGGELLIVNDNDGVDDSNGETQLMRIDID